MVERIAELTAERDTASTTAVLWAQQVKSTEADRDRLRNILACERGEAAPEGWVWTTYAIGDGNTHGEWQRRALGVVLALSVWRGKVGTWHWQVHPPGGTQQGAAASALEAIEAADAAVKSRLGEDAE